MALAGAAGALFGEPTDVGVLPARRVFHPGRALRDRTGPAGPGAVSASAKNAAIASVPALHFHPVPSLELKYSKSEVNRAGNVLRDRWLSDLSFSIRSPVDAAEIVKSFEVAYHFRACHAYPLQKVTMGLRSAVQTETMRSPVVAQRFKRIPSMLNKLIRYPDMALARMQDIGGCRAILRDGEEVRRVLRRIRKNWRPPDNRIKDYIANPAPSGYRGIHVILERDDRLIEVQLRTPIQHEWAIAVERMGSRHGFDLKSGKGPQELLRFFQVASEGMALEERGVSPDEIFMARFGEAQKGAATWMGGQS